MNPQSARGLTPLYRSWIYVAADAEADIANALGCGADVVILDLEDLVTPGRKLAARERAREVLASWHIERWPRIYVRVDPAHEWMADDLEAVVMPALSGLRIPKATDPEAVAELSRRTGLLEQARDMSPGQVAFICNVESAAGVLHALELLERDPRVEGLGFGEADFSRDVGARVGSEQLETLVARSTLVLASSAARKRPPCEGAYLRRSDLAGLARSTRRSRALGFFGRTAVDPSHIPVINEVFTPTREEVSWAHEVIRLLDAAEREGSGSAWHPDGSFVDAAITRAADDLLALAAAFAVRTSSSERPR